MPTWSRQLLNFPNAITLARLPLFGWFVWAAATGRPQLALTLFLLVWALDWADGLIARWLGQATKVGYYLDKLVDRFVMVLGVVVMIRFNILPPVALLLMVRDIGYIPAVYPFQNLKKNWHGARVLGKITTLLQGVGFLWLYLAVPYSEIIVGITAILGGIAAVRHLRQLMIVTLLLLGLPASAHASVVLNELMWDGVEYVELYNSGSEATSLAGWKLTRQQADKEEKTIIVFSENTVVPSGGYFLLEKSEDATTVSGDAVSSALTLVNTGELVRLYNASGHIVDTAGQFGSWLAGKNTDTGISMERVDTSSAGGWQTSSGDSGGRSGTPRALNSSGSAGTDGAKSTDGNSGDQPGDSQQVYATSIIINEFLPNPIGDDAAGEFIELFNPSEQTADLSGWQLDDAAAGSKAYALPAGTIVGARTYRVFMREQTGIALNNTGDEVRLLDPVGKVHVQAHYNESAPDGQSYNWMAGSYVRSTTTTPGSANVVIEPTTKDKEEKAASASTQPTITTGPTPKTAGAVSSAVIIFRVLPDPIGDDAVGEFIELKNTGGVSVDLSGWQLDDEDGGSTPYIISSGVHIAAGETLSFSREDTSIALNNNGDTARLLAPDGSVVDELPYDDVDEGQVLEVGSGSANNANAPAANSSGRVAGVQAAAANDDDPSNGTEIAAGVPQVIAGLTGGSGAADRNSLDQGNTSNVRGIALGVVLVLGAGVVAALTFGDKETLRRWIALLVSWRRT